MKVLKVLKNKLIAIFLIFAISLTLSGCQKEVTIIGKTEIEVEENFQFEVLEEVSSVSFSSSDASIASVSVDGIVTGVSEGNVSIFVSTNQGRGKINITVVSKRYLEIINSTNLAINENNKLEVILFPNEIEVSCTWKSSNPLVVHVDDLGNTTALNSGSAVITASYINSENLEIFTTTEINVFESVLDVEKIEISGKNAVTVGKEISLSYQSYPNNEDVIWSISNEEIAVIDNNGVILGIKEGKAIVTATSKTNPNVLNNKIITVVKKAEDSRFLDAQYIVEEVEEYNELPLGIIHTKNVAYTSTPLSGVDADGYSGITEEIVPNKLYKQQVNVIEVPSSKDIKITTWANLDNNKWALTTVKGLIQKYESANPGWKVIAAINGDFFDINGNNNLPYQTNGALVSDGEFYKTSSGNIVGFTNNGTSNSLIGNKELKRTDNMILAIYDEFDNIIKEFNIDTINSNPKDNETSIYFATYNSEKEIVPVDLSLADGAAFVVNDAIKALPNNENDFYGLGIISSIDKVVLQKGSFAIVTNNSEIKDTLKLGTKIRCQYEYVGEYSEITDATGCGNTLLPATSSVIDDRAPRTVIGKKADGTIVMMVIDGRQGNKGMYGADARELGAIMQAYGCIEAYNLDGGGSSTIVIRENDGFVTKNSPSDGRERSDANCIIIAVKDPIIEYSVNEELLSQTSITLNVNVSDNMGKSIEKLYIDFNNELYEVVDGKVTIDNLIHNTKYNFDFYYETIDGKIYSSLTSGSATTLKNMPVFYHVVVEETSETYEFYIFYNDSDKASNMANASLDCCGFSLFMNNGKYSLKKSSIKEGNYLEDIDVIFSYALGSERRKTIKLEDVEYLYINSIEEINK